MGTNKLTSMNGATLRLFNAIYISAKVKSKVKAPICNERTIRHGYVLDSAMPELPDGVLDEIENVIGISGEKANAAFHKAWITIENTPQEVLWTQAIVHYFTTYGFENLGMYDESTVYIPHERLDIPEVRDNISFTIIKAITSKELLQKIVALAKTGVALRQETLDDIMTIVANQHYEYSDFSGILNRELSSLIRDYYDAVPDKPVDFLRYLITKLTDESLLIKNKHLIDKIKESNGKFLDQLMKSAPDDLASIFLRYKPLFLAMKSISKNKGVFNRLRRQAIRQHKPLKEDYLNNVTARLKNGTLDFQTLTAKLEKAGIFRKTRLAYALKYRMAQTQSIVYRIRNGKGWAADFKNIIRNSDALIHALQLVMDSIADDLDLNGMTVYIPRHMHYALPATEKQFIGNIPVGSYILIPDNMIAGIHWFNVDNYRIDLDLASLDMDGSKVGWDSHYKTGGVLFSGDMTTAPKPNGASELLYVKKGFSGCHLVTVNYYNFDSSVPVPTKLLVACETAHNFGGNYMVDTNNILAQTSFDITNKQNVLGLLVGENGVNKFYFSNINIGGSITSGNSDVTRHAREYLLTKTKSIVDLAHILTLAGATVVNDAPDGIDYIDLSPEMLEKGSIISLLTKNI